MAQTILVRLGFPNFAASHVFEYYETFMLTSVSVVFLLLFDRPNFLQRRKRKRKTGLYGPRYSSEGTHSAGNSSGRASSLDIDERSAWISDQESEAILGKEQGAAASRRGDKSGIEGSFSQIMTSGSFSDSQNVQRASHEGAGAAAAAAIGAVNSGGVGNPSSFDMSAFPRMMTNELASPALFFRESSVSGSLAHRNSLRSLKSYSEDSVQEGPASGKVAPIYSPFRRTGGGQIDESDLINRRGPNVSLQTSHTGEGTENAYQDTKTCSMTLAASSSGESLDALWVDLEAAKRPCCTFWLAVLLFVAM